MRLNRDEENKDFFCYKSDIKGILIAALSALTVYL